MRAGASSSSSSSRPRRVPEQQQQGEDGQPDAAGALGSAAPRTLLARGTLRRPGAPDGGGRVGGFRGSVDRPAGRRLLALPYLLPLLLSLGPALRVSLARPGRFDAPPVLGPHLLGTVRSRRLLPPLPPARRDPFVHSGRATPGAAACLVRAAASQPPTLSPPTPTRKRPPARGQSASLLRLPRFVDEQPVSGRVVSRCWRKGKSFEWNFNQRPF